MWATIEQLCHNIHIILCHISKRGMLGEKLAQQTVEILICIPLPRSTWI